MTNNNDVLNYFRQVAEAARLRGKVDKIMANASRRDPAAVHVVHDNVTVTASLEVGMALHAEIEAALRDCPVPAFGTDFAVDFKVGPSWMKP